MNQKPAYTLAELIAVVGILGILAAVVLPRVAGHSDQGKRAACKSCVANIELQAKLWQRNTGSYPSADLSDIGANTDYFPSGVPACPVSGAGYQIDSTRGTVTGHSH